jgi:homoserine dehydrogenase
MDKTKVAVIGLGTIGSGVVRLLLDHGDRIARHAGRRLWLEKAVDLDVSRARRCNLPEGVFTDKIDEVINDPAIEVVVQLIGGLEPARTIMLRLLGSGKNIVTANKALLAEHGPELFDRARELGRSIAFEAAVAGGVPIIASIGQCMSANRIESISGILNGTSNFILSQMVSNGTPYDDAVAEAQRLGFAEANPAMDVDGTDMAQKLAILAQLAFGAPVRWSDIPRQGIDTLDLIDVQYAQEMGYQVKLLAVARRAEGGLELHVSPTLVRTGTPLADVQGAYNAVSVVGDAVGSLFFQGLGAGQMPTASAVVADVIDTAVGRTALTFRALELWSKGKEPAEGSGNRASDYVSVAGRFYLRVMVHDHPGVLAQVMTALGDQDISIASVYQQEVVGALDGAHDADQGNADVVPLVIMTHATTEGAARQACQVIDRLDAVQSDTVRMWVRD